MDKQTKGFKINDEVKCIDKACSLYGKSFLVSATSDSLSAPSIYLKGLGGDYFQHRFELVNTANLHPVGTIFSCLNEEEAIPYIGREVECCDNDDYRMKKPWDIGIFIKLNDKDSDYPFTIGNSLYDLIRLTPASFIKPKPAVDPGLITALKLSVQQWQIMYDTGKTKEEVFDFLSGTTGGVIDCFLCAALRTDYSSMEECKNCIKWHGAPNCVDDVCTSVYLNYCSDVTSKPAQLTMLNHLKSELTRLEGEAGK